MDCSSSFVGVNIYASRRSGTMDTTRAVKLTGCVCVCPSVPAVNAQTVAMRRKLTTSIGIL